MKVALIKVRSPGSNKRGAGAILRLSSGGIGELLAGFDISPSTQVCCCSNERPCHSERNVFVGDFGAASGWGGSTVRIISGRGVAFHVVAAGARCATTSASRGAFGAASQHAEIAGDDFKAGAL